MPGDGSPTIPQARRHRSPRARRHDPADRPADTLTGRPWLLVDLGGVLDHEDHPDEASARQRLTHPLWARRPWQIYDPNGRPTNYRKDQR